MCMNSARVKSLTSNILCISHTLLLSSLTAKQFAEKIKPKLLARRKRRTHLCGKDGEKKSVESKVGDQTQVWIMLCCLSSIHLSIHPFSTAYLGWGNGGSSLSREAQTSPSPVTSSSTSGGVPRPAERHSPSSVSWVSRGAFYRWDVP